MPPIAPRAADSNPLRMDCVSVNVKALLNRTATLAAAALLFSWAAVACEDDPFGLNSWVANPDTVQLFSLARPELNLNSAYDFVSRLPVRIERAGTTGSWDLVVDTEGGELVLLPASALGIDSEARVAELPGIQFDEATEAPADSAAYSPAGVALRTTSVYVFRTRLAPDPVFGRSCTFYGKLQPLSVDVDEGMLEFMFDVNTSLSGCNNRDLVPPN